ncbi:N-acetyl sugar amidotransferase [Pedobacter polaris]|uniref:N-acetyl sugar amidotransferase n=1 Tax=Pedobacter polaris TaxID=2571273 RepID=A0A4U1CZN0_9SPHI|nr:N-acetyl sugar amidotransferase [Pedobacter polaris]TKC13068.1 N-acetyl sugar amidotransferase [Pedobacter polaris]
MARAYEICTRCVMDTSDPAIVFDEQGVCNHCHTHDLQIQRKVVSGEEGEKKLEEIVAKIKEQNKNNDYDCVIGVSGGVDSTYVAYKVKQLGLRPLAVHLDNGWDSELAIKNVENICRKLEIDLHTIVLDWNEFRDLQIAFLKASTPDSEIPSDHAIVVSMLKTAKMINVGHILTGYNVKTETHLPAEWSQGHFDWGYIKNIHKQFGKVKLKTFPHLNLMHFLFPPYSKKFINILDYIDFSKKDAMPILEKEIGWRYYGGKHYESIYTRWFQGYWLPTKFGYDKRRSHLSSVVCSGEMTREEALEELKKSTYPEELQKEDTAYVLKKFDLTKDQLDEIMNLPKKSYWDYAPYGRIYRTLLYRVLRKMYRSFKK